MKTPLISIIVPIYKVEAYLDECVQSIVNQTYQNLEIILVDDGSPDRCPQICDAWGEKDQRVRVVHKENGGLSSARNAGLDIAKGEYIGFVDSDDHCAETMYEELLSALSHSTKKIAYSYSLHEFADGRILQKRNGCALLERDENDAIKALFLGDIDISVMNKLYHKSLFETLRFPVGVVNEDAPMWIPLLVSSGGIVHTGKAHYFYRVNELGISKSGTYLREANSDIVWKHLEIMKDQSTQYGLKCKKEYGIYCARNAFQIAITMEKRYRELSEKVKRDYKIYRKLMWQYARAFLLSDCVKAKDKVLYILLLLELVRPVYRLLGKK